MVVKTTAMLLQMNIKSQLVVDNGNASLIPRNYKPAVCIQRIIKLVHKEQVNIRNSINAVKC